jgi:hypothetical protein
MFIMMLVYFLYILPCIFYFIIFIFFWVCCHAFIILFYFIFFFWIALPCTHFFENYGLGLGLALFSLGIQVGPAMKKNLSWKFFRSFRENLGFETCFKFQFGDSLAWMTIQVSNWVIQRFGSSNPNTLGMIWLG